MREIKFRVWDNILKCWSHNSMDWLYGDGFVQPDCGNRYIFVQYTGLKDKNGKEIYEGDLLQELNTEERVWDGDPWEGIVEVPIIGEVVYDAPVFNVIQKRIGRIKLNKGGYSEIHLSKYDGFFMWDSAGFKVIGNIHENPELINNGRKE